MIKKIAFVGVPVKDVAGSKRFWGELLGLELAQNYGERWLEYDTPERKTIALDTFTPELSHDTSLYLSLETDDIAAEVARLREHGVKVVKDVWENKEPDGTPICKMAIIVDPEAHTIMLHEIAPHRR